jgi:aquaporin Z
MTNDWTKYMAEFWGTFILAFVGLGALILPTSATIYGIFAFGLALAAIMYIFGAISGAHVNPAVSLACAIRGKISWKDFIFYVIAQILGALLGMLLLFGIYRLFSPTAAFDFGERYTVTGLSMINGLFAHLILGIVLSYIFALAWLGITHKSENKNVIGIAIGMLLMAVMLSGAILNPALSLSQAIFGGVNPLAQVWLFIVAPLVGGALAGLTAWCMFKDTKETTATSTANSAR